MPKDKWTADWTSKMIAYWENYLSEHPDSNIAFNVLDSIKNLKAVRIKNI